MSDKGIPKETSHGKGSSSDNKKDKKVSRLAEKMNKISSWLSTSEPSAHALKQHKKEAFEKAGISPNDVDANAKLHAPIGTIPEDAIKPAAGPSPEEVVKKKRKAREKQQKGRQGSVASGSGSRSVTASGSASFSGGSSSIQTPSISGYSSSMPGLDTGNSIYRTGEDDFGANGWGPR